MRFWDMRYLSTRSTSRQVRYVLFTFIMICQVIFWTYVAIIGTFSSTKALPRQLPIKREINDDFKNLDSHPGHPNDIKPVLKESAAGINDTIRRNEGREKYKDKHLFQALIKYGNEKKEHKTAKVSDQDFDKYFNPLLHHTLLHRDASVIWKSPFIFNPETICSRHNDLDLLVIVHTAPYNFRRREMIRQQIADEQYNLPYTVQPVFMIGSVKDEKRNSSKEESIVTEYKIHGDLVKMNFAEDFRNLSLKAVMWLRWTNEHCPSANMILKIDDDVVIDMKKILPLSRGLFSKYKKSIFCHLNKIGSQPIPRRGRTEVDPREFMRMAFYPYSYCSGFIVFLTSDIIPDLEKTARKIPFYNVDDVYMFGMVPKFSGGVTYHNIGYNVSIWNQKVFKCQQNQGSVCPYFGTMGEEEMDRLNVWTAMRRNHQADFHFPTMNVA